MNLLHEVILEIHHLNFRMRIETEQLNVYSDVVIGEFMILFQHVAAKVWIKDLYTFAECVYFA